MRNKLLPLRIDYFNDFPLTLEGAESIHVHEICKSLQILGCNIRLFSPTTNTRLYPGVTFIPLPTPPFFKSIFCQITVIPKLLRLWSRPRSRPDAIYLRVSPVLVVPVLLAAAYKIPVVAEINGTIHEELVKANTRHGRVLLTFRISDTVEKIVYHLARHVITVTESLKSYLVDRFHVASSKIVVIQNGVDSDMLKPLARKTPPDSKRSPRPIVVGYVGGLMWWQGLAYLIDAIAHLLSQGENIQLVIVGDGPELTPLKRQAHDANIDGNIRFVGKINHSQVNKTINSFDICVAYYVKARAGLNSPFKIYEYLSCGKPVIVSDVLGIGDKFREITQVVLAEDTGALAQAISSLAHNPRKRQAMGTQARHYILNGHTWRETSKKILETIHNSMR